MHPGERRTDRTWRRPAARGRSEEHTSELQSHNDIVCRLLLDKKTSLIERNYNEPDNPIKSVYNVAIALIVHSLDPHSNLFAPQCYAVRREYQSRKYCGVVMAS